MRTYRGNRIDRDDQREIRNSIGEEHLPETTSTTGDYEPQAADGHDEDDQVEGHSCPRWIREGRMGELRCALTVHVQGLEDGRGCASDDALAELGSPFRLDLEKMVGRM